MSIGALVVIDVHAKAGHRPSERSRELKNLGNLFENHLEASTKRI